MNNEYSAEAYVTQDENGQPILVDPQAHGVMLAIGKHYCDNILKMNEDRVAHLRERARQLGKSPHEAVIVLVNADDPHGAVLADILMPGHDWNQFRAIGKIPFARGLAGRQGVIDFIKAFEPSAEIPDPDSADVQVVVIDHGTFKIY